MTLANSALADIHRLLGECLIQLQRYEGLSKAILAAHQVTITCGDHFSAMADRKARLGGATLGGLVGQMTGAFLVATGQPDNAPEQTDAHVTLTTRIAFTPEAFAQVEAELRDLVALRNRLVHHFLDDHDLGSDIGRRKTKASLEDALRRITAADAHLRDWAADMGQVQTAMAETLAAPEVQEWLTKGRVPWAYTSIVQALREASAELGAGGWTSVDAAVAWVKTNYPGEAPDGYGCTTWRQVIHKSKLFDLKRHQDGPRTIALYRPRAGGPPRP